MLPFFSKNMLPSLGYKQIICPETSRQSVRVMGFMAITVYFMDGMLK